MESGDVFIYDMLGQEILSQRISDSDMTKIRVTKEGILSSEVSIG